jgi:hypothetical protein
MKPKTKIWLDRIEWNCGDGCCSETYYEINCNSGNISYRIHKQFDNIGEVIKFFGEEYPDYEIDIDACPCTY